MAIKLEPNKLFQISLISFIIIVGISWLINQFAPGTLPNIKAGWIFLLFGLVILLTTLFNLGINITQIKMKEIILMVVILIIVVALYFVLPLAIPSIFSIIPGNEINYQLRDFFTKTIGSAMSLGGTNVVG